MFGCCSWYVCRHGHMFMPYWAVLCVRTFLHQICKCKYTHIYASHTCVCVVSVYIFCHVVIKHTRRLKGCQNWQPSMMDDAVLDWFLPGVVWWEFKCYSELLFVFIKFCFSIFKGGKGELRTSNLIPFVRFFSCIF